MNIPDLLDNQSDIRLRPVRERESAIIEYRIIIATLIREIRKEFNISVLPALKAERLYQADAAGWFTALKATATAAVNRAIDKVRRLFSLESDSHLKRFWRSVTKGTRLDLPPQVLNNLSKQDQLLRDYVDRNTSLIESVSADVVKRIEQAVYQAKLDNWSIKQLSEHLTKQFGITQNRAKVIAVDQMSSLNADLNKMRALEAGIDGYTWIDQADGRVRPLHLSLRGKQYKWGEKTGAEGGLEPGKPIGCRCIAALAIPGKQAKKPEPLNPEEIAAIQAMGNKRASNG